MRRHFSLFTRRRAKIAAGLLGVLVALWFGSSLLVAYTLTQRLQPWVAEPAPAIENWHIETQRLATVDGQDIGSWFVPGPENAPTVVLLPGLGGSRSSFLSLGGFFKEQGCSVLLLSLRAHGDSSGEWNDIGYSARHDVVAAVEFLERHRPGRPVILQGTSLGAAAAIFAARELGTRIQGYLLESPYQDLRTAVRHRTQAALPPMLEWLAYQGLVCAAPLVLPEIDRIAPIDCIAEIPESVPILLLAGEADALARPEEARALYDRVSSHARLVSFDGAGHVSLFHDNPALYRESVEWLLCKVAKGGSDSAGPSRRPGD